MMETEEEVSKGNKVKMVNGNTQKWDEETKSLKQK